MGSNSHPKTGFQKNVEKNPIFNTPHTPLAAARARFSLFDKMCLWHPFGSHFGGVLGAQMEAKAIKKPLQKNINKNDAQNEPQTGPKGGPKMKPKSSKMTSWKHIVSRVAPKWFPDTLQDRFWRGVGIMLGTVSPFCACILCDFWRRS